MNTHKIQKKQLLINLIPPVSGEKSLHVWNIRIATIQLDGMNAGGKGTERDAAGDSTHVCAV